MLGEIRAILSLTLNLSGLRDLFSWKSILDVRLTIQRLGRMYLLFCLSLLCIACWLGSPLPVLAQTTAPSAATINPEPSAPTRSILSADDIASEKVSQFVQAYLKVLALVEQREGELQRAETELEYLRVQQEIETEAFATIQQAGLTSQEYLQLLGLANTDPEFGERVAALLQESGE